MLMHTREGTTIVTQQEKLKTKLDSAVVSIDFQGALSSFSHFLDCFLSLSANFKAHSLAAKRFCRLLLSWSQG